MSGSNPLFRWHMLLSTLAIHIPFFVIAGRDRSGPAVDLMQQVLVEKRVRALFCTLDMPCYRQYHQAFLQNREKSIQHESSATCFNSGTAKQPAKLTILSLASGLPADYMQLLRKNRLNEANKYGYEYCEYDHALEDTRDLAWSKVIAIRVLLEHKRKQVVWMDADAVITNPKPFEDITAPFFNAGKDIVFTNDFDEHDSEPTPRSSINSGVLVARNTPWTQKFWKSIWKDFPEAINHPWWEQQAILLYRDRNFEDFSKHAQIIRHHLMNEWFRRKRSGDFIDHSADGHAFEKYHTLTLFLSMGNKSLAL